MDHYEQDSLAQENKEALSFLGRFIALVLGEVALGMLLIALLESG